MCLTDEFLLFLITVSPDNGPVFEEETDKPLNIFLPSLYSEIYSILRNADIICVVVQQQIHAQSPQQKHKEKVQHMFRVGNEVVLVSLLLNLNTSYSFFCCWV